MADLTKSISDSINVLGPAEANDWNAFNWGEAVWGASVDPQFDLYKYLFETITNTDSVTILFTKLLSDSYSGYTDDTTDIYVRDADGYYRQFIDNVTDADDRSDVSWSASSDPSTTWTKSSDPSTSWSES